MIILKISIFFVILIIGKCEETEDLVIQTENGKIVGEFREFFHAFEGIPYAEPPINENRFAPPKPLKEKWSNIREFKKYGEPCIQWDHFGEHGHAVLGAEDCLTLNVYTPRSVQKATHKFPVFFFIHGGAFMFGGSFFYNPKYFMYYDVIVVTINYRLGPMGFLSTEDQVIPGNMGLKDQVMALRWVHQNIGNFGGDSNLLTITGYSAGGASVHLHYLSPLTKGLFKNGVSFSGSALNPWVIAENSREKSHAVAKKVNCPFDDHEEMLKCLKSKPAEKIVETMAQFQPFLYNPFSPLGVVVEKQKSPDAFLTDFPRNLLKKEQFQKLPWLVSTTEAEGLYPAAEFYNDEILEKINNEWITLAPHLLDFNGTFSDPIRKAEIAKKIREHYLDDKESCHKISKEHFFGLRDIISDRLYKYGINKAIHLQADISPTFFYNFDFKTLFGVGEYMSKQKKVNLGSSHGEDVLLMFHTMFREDIPLTEEEEQMRVMMIDLLIGFSLQDRVFFNEIELERIRTDDIKYLEIKSLENYKIQEFGDFGNASFWDDTISYKNEN